MPLQAPYVASKFGVRGFYDTLRMELADEGAPVAVTLILPASINTPLFQHARSKLGVVPRVPPPVYPPEEVAHALVRAAQQPTREVPVGGGALGFLLGQRFSPALTDAALTTGRLGFRGQRTNRPDDGVDNLDAPAPGPGRVRGDQPARISSTAPSPGSSVTCPAQATCSPGRWGPVDAARADEHDTLAGPGAGQLVRASVVGQGAAVRHTGHCPPGSPVSGACRSRAAAIRPSSGARR